MGLSRQPEQEAAFATIVEEIEAAQTICIQAHTNPDGDALGSGLALTKIMQAKWPNKDIVALLADDFEIPRIYRFLPYVDELMCASQYEGSPDLFISVDVSTPDRLSLGKELMLSAKRRVIFDHHPCQEPLADAYIIRTSAAATGVIISEFAMFLGEAITPDVANLLMCAIMTDTGRFQYQNADPEAFAIASHLVDAGANPSLVSLNVYQNFTLQYLHLEAQVMARIVTFEDGKIAYSYATQADFERTGASLDECDGLIDVVRSVSGSTVALFLKELPDGQVRGNLRSKCDLDISGVARALGGGGHKAAAGFTVEGDISEALTQVLDLLCNVVRNGSN